MASVSAVRKVQFFESQWHDFEYGTSNLLISQHASGASTGTFHFRGTKYDVDFRRLVQTNTQTGYQRNIRIVGGNGGGSPSSGTSSSIWEWNEGARWTQYDQSTQTVLTSAMAAGQSSVQVKFGVDFYIIDLSRRTQTNSRTGYSRKIRGPAVAAASSGTGTLSGGSGGGGRGGSGGSGGGGFFSRAFKSLTGGRYTSSRSSSSSSSSSSSTRIRVPAQTIQFHRVDRPAWQSITEWERVHHGNDYDPKVSANFFSHPFLSSLSLSSLYDIPFSFFDLGLCSSFSSFFSSPLLFSSSFLRLSI